jgi:hypothetical protein
MSVVYRSSFPFCGAFALQAEILRHLLPVHSLLYLFQKQKAGNKTGTRCLQRACIADMYDGFLWRETRHPLTVTGGGLSRYLLYGLVV